MANRDELKEQWQQRLKSWRESGLNQKQWCEQNNVRQHRFWYWKKKLEEIPVAQGKNKPAYGFVPAVLAPEPKELVTEPAPLSISLPSGLKVSGIDHSNLSLARQLIGLLQ